MEFLIIEAVPARRAIELRRAAATRSRRRTARRRLRRLLTGAVTSAPNSGRARVPTDQASAGTIRRSV